MPGPPSCQSWWIESEKTVPPKFWKGKGGVFPARGKSLDPRNLKYFVNIRPKCWDDRFTPAKIWIGSIQPRPRAQCIADFVYYYCGNSPYHFADAIWNHPPLHCMGRDGNPAVLTSREMCSLHVAYIAKGTRYKRQRQDFIDKVKAMVLSPEYSLQVTEFLESLTSTHGDSATPVDQLIGATNQSPPERAAALPRDEDANNEDWEERQADLDFMMKSVTVSSGETAYIASFEFDLDNNLQSTCDCPFVSRNGFDKKIEEPSTSLAFTDSSVPPPSESNGLYLKSSHQNRSSTPYVGRIVFDKRTEESGASSASADFFSSLSTADEDNLPSSEMYCSEAMATNNDFVENICSGWDQFRAEQWMSQDEQMGT